MKTSEIPDLQDFTTIEPMFDESQLHCLKPDIDLQDVAVAEGLEHTRESVALSLVGKLATKQIKHDAFKAAAAAQGVHHGTLTQQFEELPNGQLQPVFDPNFWLQGQRFDTSYNKATFQRLVFLRSVLAGGDPQGRPEEL